MRTNDWITPRWILEALGQFELDPCACTPQPWPTATRMMTRHDKGLSQDWAGRVWLNPPYGKAIGDWMCRMAEHNHGVALIFARTDTAWFHDYVWGHAAALLFLEGRVWFHYPDGRRAEGNGGSPSVLVAYGEADAERLRLSSLRGAFVRELLREANP